MKINRASILQWPTSRFFGDKSPRFLNLRNQSRSRRKLTVCDHITALYLIDRNVGETERSAHTRLCAINFDAVTLNGADSRPEVLRLNTDALATMESSAS